MNKIKSDHLYHEVISRDAIMDILDRFERQAIEAVKTDRKINADNYESVGQCKLIANIRKSIDRKFRKNCPKSSYSLDDLLKPGKLWPENTLKNYHPEPNPPEG